MKKIQIIYSTLEDGQHCANVPLPDSALVNNEVFKDFCLAVFHGKYSFMADGWRDDIYANAKTNSFFLPCNLATIPKLVKISTWVDRTETRFDLPDWYITSEGKFYWDELNPGEPRPF